MKKFKCWIEAVRLRTLPASVSGVVTAMALAASHHSLDILPAMLCLAFAVLAQIASNFANEYYDFKAGLDKPGREGPRRGVTEGDISPKAMRNATFATLGVACVIGCSLIAYSGWWLIPVGIFIALGALAYSTGPYPLSHHGLGEVAVMIFFGIIPVNFTYYLASGQWSVDILYASLAVGFMVSNIIIVNNYRDADADAEVGKRTLAVTWGRKALLAIYLANGIAASALICISFAPGTATTVIMAIYLALHILLTLRINRLKGSALNPMLGITAILIFAVSIALLISAECNAA
ncbi:MAG: 1,4-dihydroxy-2-naphthoate octaprenyltransferase [Muribaculaceae bacterium]|nr:1,4-dihydroxy-2-naphthoate octaprenyltransferase [Muribaculaceae bacterium]